MCIREPLWVGTDVSALQLPVSFIMSRGEEVKAKKNRNNGSLGGRPLNRLPRRTLPFSASNPSIDPNSTQTKRSCHQSNYATLMAAWTASGSALMPSWCHRSLVMRKKCIWRHWGGEDLCSCLIWPTEDNAIEDDSYFYRKVSNRKETTATVIV